MNPDDVTLIVPCYNVADTLPRVLDAVDDLDPAPETVLCIDDGSTDGTTDLIASREGIELVEHAENRGLGVTLNRGLAHTRTPWLAKIDGDIVVDADWLERICRHSDEQNADFVYGRFEEETTTIADKWREKHPSPPFPDEPIHNVAINGANMLGRVDALYDVGGWDEYYHRAFDDIDLIQRLIHAGHHVYYAPDVKTTHIRTDTWYEVLRTAWSYHTDAIAGHRNPERVRDVLTRLPGLSYRAVNCIADDVRDGDFDILWISLLRFFFHLKWDFDSVRASNDDEDRLTETMEYAGVTLHLENDAVTDRIEWMLRYGLYETEETEFAEQYINPDMDVVELGGGIGYLSCYINTLISEDRTHLVVEPNRHLLPILEHNRDLNRASFSVLNAAYASTNTAVDLRVPKEFWTASLHSTETVSETLHVGTTSLRTLVERYDLSDIALVVDIEGSEIDLLENELDVIGSHCRLLIVEFHDESEDGPGDPEQTTRVRQRLEDRSFELLDEENDVAVYRPAVESD